MRKYDNYIDSNIEWLGDIPSHWTLTKNKRVLNLLTDFTANGSFGDLAKNVQYLDSGYARLVRLTDLRLNLNNSGLYVSKYSYEYLKKSSLKGGELVVANVGANVGTVCIVPETDEIKTLGPNMFLVGYKNVLNKKYIFYLLCSDFLQYEFKIVATTTAQPKLNKDQFRSLNITIPPLIEQQAIANYLDAKTQAIDKKVTLLEQKIETYKKLKNTIIAKAVTQSISNQEQSINDLGFKTPANWTKYRLKDLGKLFSGLSGKSGDDFNQEDNPNNRGFIPFTNIANNTYLKKDHLGTVVINPGEKQNKVRKGDLFFLMSSEGYGDIGKTAVLADDIDEAYLNSFCKGYRVNQNKCNPYFLNYLLLSNIYRQRLIVEGKGFTRINLKMEKITDFEIFLPPTLSEQQEIANYIDHKTATIDAIVSNIGKQIETLKQLRKTLINDVVTGKIKII